MKKIFIFLVAIPLIFLLPSIANSACINADGSFNLSPYPSCGGNPTMSISCGNARNCADQTVNGVCQTYCDCDLVYQGNSLTTVTTNSDGSCTPVYGGGFCQDPAGTQRIAVSACGSGTSGGGTVTATTPSYSIDIAPLVASVLQGQSTSYTITINPNSAMANSSVNLALDVNTCPTGSTCSFVGGYTGSYQNSDGFTYSGVQQKDISFGATPSPQTVVFTVNVGASTATFNWPIVIKTKSGWGAFGPSASAQLAVSSSAGTNPSITVDVPANNATVSGTVSTSGWAIDNTTSIENAISSVKVYLDGFFLTNATYGGSRTDVCTVYPGRVGCSNVGWSYNWNSVGATNGSHTLRFDAIDTDPTPHVASVTRTVTLANAPTVTLSAAPASGTGSVNPRLTWSPTNASSCSASANPANASWTGAKSATASSQNLSGVTVTTIFSITCTNAYGSATANATVTVTPAAPTVTISGSPTTGPAPLTSTVTWSSTGSGNTCNASGGWVASNIGSSGTHSVTTSVTTTITITCTNAGGSGSNAVTLNPSASNYTLTVSANRGGRVTSTDGFISCPVTCSRSYTGGTTVTLNAVPQSGYWKFLGWSGACTGTGSCVVNMNANTNVSATFIPQPSDYREF